MNFDWLFKRKIYDIVPSQSRQNMSGL